MCYYGQKLFTVSYHLSMIGVHKTSASRDITYLICHVSSQDHMIEGSFDVMGASSSLCFTTLAGLVAVGLMLVGRCFDQQIAYACLNPPLLFISGAHGMGVRGVFWGSNE